MFGEDVFEINHTPNSQRGLSLAKTKSVNGRSITVVNTPGFFDTDRSEEELKPEIVSCITECAPGPHAFLIVLKVEKFTEQEQAVITKICQYFSEEALKYAVVVFTHGDQLREGMKIGEFVDRSKLLRDLVNRCGGRCHVIDNRHWKNKKGDDYRCNQFQVAELLNTLDKAVEANGGSYYTNEMLQEVKTGIEREEERIRQSSAGKLSQEEIRNKAKKTIFDRFLTRAAGILMGTLLGALFGVGAMVASTLPRVKNLSDFKALASAATQVALKGSVKGGKIGFDVAEGAEGPVEAIKKTAEAVWNQFV
ncbi:GTPase IMAP family member 7-like [Pempheris klunzingeri]|uniref:GTPase IMAP family member 7-like n=1 Tax=Pempheris klunzingeri TaxID=3127111 RepID=UPI0039810B07